MTSETEGRNSPSEQGPLAQYWDAAANGRFVIPECCDCHHRFLPPRLYCPSCGSASVVWFESNGHGELYAYSVIEKAPSPGFAKSVPYIIALATLDDLSRGSRLYARLLDTDSSKVRVGQRVSVAIRKLEEGRALPVLLLTEAR
jgi:uncharacterized OB-fold protein